MILLIQGPVSATTGFTLHLSDSSRRIKQLIFPRSPALSFISSLSTWEGVASFLPIYQY